MAADSLLVEYHTGSYGGQVRIIVLIAWAVINHFSNWFASNLSIFYLLKLVNFSRSLFLHLRRRKRINLIHVICFLLLIYSLCKCVRKMQLHDTGSQDPSTKVHMKTWQTVVSFLLLFARYSLSTTTVVWNSSKLLLH
ncbi:putative taste receptor type 2 member 36 [Sciurus carolinensis]|uniref:putative taste receptor type 2 member 36 n=1 Tax=Sciurus carolinensis TaxID=30640 RepID=UPI001FB3B40B|nr:putative taste receptor type 2 member 36 [Sciurus carolinensis]